MAGHPCVPGRTRHDIEPCGIACVQGWLAKCRQPILDRIQFGATRLPAVVLVTLRQAQPDRLAFLPDRLKVKGQAPHEAEKPQDFAPPRTQWQHPQARLRHELAQIFDALLRLHPVRVADEALDMADPPHDIARITGRSAQSAVGGHPLQRRLRRSLCQVQFRLVILPALALGFRRLPHVQVQQMPQQNRRIRISSQVETGQKFNFCGQVQVVPLRRQEFACQLNVQPRMFMRLELE